MKKVADGSDFDSLGKLEHPDTTVLLGGAESGELAGALTEAAFSVSGVDERPYRRSPAAPFITSTLQQEAARKLHFSAQRAMQVAQRLYEQGYITYMRTDSTTLSETALHAAREQAAPENTGYRNADRLMDDIDLMRDALAASGARRLSDALLVPLRREIGVFRFSTVRLDVRENSARINQTLAAMFRHGHDGAEPPAAESAEWKRWLLAELGTARSERRPFEGLPDDAAETLATFRTIARMSLCRSINLYVSNPLFSTVAGFSTGSDTIAFVRYPSFCSSAGKYKRGTNDLNSRPSEPSRSLNFKKSRA